MKEIVIKLEDDAYNFICSKGYHTQSLYNAIKKGVVLPEHGRLIDADRIPYVRGISDACLPPFIYEYEVNKVPTILEGTKGQKSEDDN